MGKVDYSSFQLARTHGSTVGAQQCCALTMWFVLMLLKALYFRAVMQSNRECCKILRCSLIPKLNNQDSK